MRLRGVVTSGMEKAADYIGMRAYQDRFNDVLGFYPFPGTLNIEVDPVKREEFDSETDRLHIESFEQDGERLSAVDVHPITICGVEAALLDLEITDHPDSIAEIIAPINLREECNLTDGDTVTVETR